MRDVRRGDIADAFAAEVERFAVTERAWRTDGQVVGREHAAESTHGDTCVRRGAQPVIHRTRFVCLEMTVGHPAQLLDRDHLAQCRMHRREQLALTAMEQQRFVGDDQILVEAQVCRLDVGGKLVNPVRDLGNNSIHGGSLSLRRALVCQFTTDG